MARAIRFSFVRAWFQATTNPIAPAEYLGGNVKIRRSCRFADSISNVSRPAPGHAYDTDHSRAIVMPPGGPVRRQGFRLAPSITVYRRSCKNRCFRGVLQQTGGEVSSNC